MKLLFPCVCYGIALFFFPFQRLQGQGNNNPTGPSGDFNGRSYTACSVDPFTGSARRIIHDLNNIPGAVGAYPLRWTRIANSRHDLSGSSIVFGQGAYWTHSYYWTIDLSINIGYPDGRLVPFLADPETGGVGPPPPGVSDRLVEVTPPVGNSLGEYDLLLADGGKVCFRRVPHTQAGGSTVYSTIVTKIVDPYLQETILSYTASGALDRITEPAGRYLQINYVTLPWQGFKAIGSVDACDGLGNVTQSVTYIYTRVSTYFTHLTGVNYSDGTHATYTYETNHLLTTCDDVRYPGPMSKILYEYLPNGTYGQLKSEKNLTTGQVVSQIAYPSDTVRVETRGDGPSRTFNYDDQGRLADYTDFKAQTSYVFYDGNGYRGAFKDARGYTTYTLREGNIGALSLLTHPDNSFRGYAYSDNNNPYYVTIRGDERGKNTYFTRDDNDHRIRKIWYPDYDPNHPDAAPTEEFTYNNFGQVLTHRLTSGGTETFAYDEGLPARGLLTSYYPPPTESDPNPQDHPTRYYYYQSGSQADRLWHVVDPRGNATWFEYNGRGQVTKVTHQDGSHAQGDYNPDGTLAWSADENHPGAANDPDQRTSYIYDEYKRIVSVTNPMNETTQVSYALDWVNPFLHTTRSVKYVVSPLNKNIVFDYDENLRKRDQVAALGTPDEAWTLFGYDEVGNLTSAQDPRWNVTTYEYDNRNRRKSMTNPAPFNNQVTRWEYDFLGNLKKEIRPDLSFRRWEYDSTNRLIDTYGFANEHTHYERDLAGNIKQLVDPKPATYLFDYDKMNRKIGATYPLDATGATRTESWHYDWASNLDQYINPAGHVRTLTYDNRNHPWDSWWDSGGGPLISPRFDYAGRLTSVTTNNGETTVAFGYDDANRKIWEEQTLVGHPTRHVQTDPDADGNRSSLQVNGTSYAIQYDYTQRNQLRTIYDASHTPWFNYSYDLSGNMTKRQAVYGRVNDSINLVDANGQNQYDALNRPLMWENTGAGDTFFARSWYQYDSLGREVGTWRDEQSGKGDAFGYDATGQLTGAVYNADGVNTGTPVNQTRAVSYTVTPDTLNRSSMNDNGDVSDYTPNALNQYENVAGGNIYYDNNFNLMWTGGLSVNYNSIRQVTSVNSGEDYGEFVYDGLGRCVKRTLDWETTLFAYDGWNPIVEWDEWDNFQAWNIYGGGSDEILWRYSDRSGHLRYHSDRHGNIVALLDYSGNGIEKYSYDAFGHPTVTDWSGQTVRDTSWYWNRFMFKGREYFAELGLYDMRNRFYHPTLGRFLQSDPIGFGAGDGNLFRYCGGDPVNRSDPSGLIVVFGAPVPGPGHGTGPADPNNYIDFYGGGDVSAGPDEISRDSRDKAKIHVFYGNMTQEEYEAYGQDAPPVTEGDNVETVRVSVIASIPGLPAVPLNRAISSAILTLANSPAQTPFGNILQTFNRGSNWRATANAFDYGVGYPAALAVAGMAVAESGAVKIDGPDTAFLNYGRGRIIGVRFINTPIIRLDYDFIPTSRSVPVYHINLGPEGTHIQIWPWD